MKRIKKTIYSIFKLVVIILVISHGIGVVFYVMDYYLYMNGVFEQECNLLCYCRLLAV